MDNFYLILVYLLIGTLLKRLPALPKNSGMVLNYYVLYVSLPALILQKVPSLHFSRQLLLPALTPWILLIVVALLILGLSRLFNWSKSITGAMLIIVPLGNTSFLGFPVVNGFYGTEAMPFAVIYDQLGTFIALATYAAIIASLYSHRTTSMSWQKMLIKIISFPSFIALIVGLLLKDHHYPAFMQQVIDNLSATLVPVVMIAVGFGLTVKLDKAHRSPLLLGLSVKLVMMPLLAWVLWSSIGADRDSLAITVSVMEAAMPPMISAGAVAMMAGLVPELCSALVSIGLLLSLITLPIWHFLLSTL